MSDPKYTGHAKPFPLQTFHGTHNKILTEESERLDNK
jgi:hypothetical protein